MSKKALNKIMRGLEEAKAYTEGEREGYELTKPISLERPIRFRSVCEATQKS